MFLFVTMVLLLLVVPVLFFIVGVAFRVVNSEIDENEPLRDLGAV